MIIKSLLLSLIAFCSLQSNIIKDIEGKDLYSVIDRDSPTSIIFYSENGTPINCCLSSIPEEKNAQIDFQCRKQAIDKNLYELDGLIIYHAVLLDSNYNVVESRAFRFAPKSVKPLSHQTVCCLKQIGYDVGESLSGIKWIGTEYCLVVWRERYDID